MAQKWRNKGNVKKGVLLVVVAVVSGFFLLESTDKEGRYLLKSKDKEFEAAQEIAKAAPQLTDVVPVAGELPWEAYLEFTVANLGGRIATVDRLLLTTNYFIAYSYATGPSAEKSKNTYSLEDYQSSFSAYLEPSHTYEIPPVFAFGGIGRGKTIEIDLDQFVETNIPDKFRVKVSVLKPYLKSNIENVTWAVQPTLLTNHGELKGPELTMQFLKPPIKPLTAGEVRELQNLLLKNGVDPGPPDGQFGKKTMQAISNFQKDVGLHVDGIPSLELLLFLRFKSKLE